MNKDNHDHSFKMSGILFIRYGFFALAVVISSVFMGSMLKSELPSFAEETFFVNTTDDLDDGSCDIVHCSLREAMMAANLKINGEGIDRIQFEIEGESPHTIILSKPLPIIIDPVIVDATTNPDFVDTPVIEISGEKGLLDGIVITAGESTIKGFAIRDFRGSGIELSGYGGNKILSNHLCTDASGNKRYPNTIGITVNNVGGNVIGGTTHDLRNVISGCDRAGIVVKGIESTNNRIIGNYIGISLNTSLLASPIGISLEGPYENVIGGEASGEKNHLWANGNEIVSDEHDPYFGDPDMNVYVDSE